MKKGATTARIWGLLLALLLPACRMQAQQPCKLMLVPEGDNQCILEAGYGAETIRACRGNTVCYTVYSTILPAPNYSWEVEGGTFQLNASQEECCVTWGDGISGRIKVSAGCPDGSVVSTELLVELMDKPTARLVSSPNYIVDPSDPTVKTIKACGDDSLIFTDNSISGETPISSYYWDGPGGVSTSGTYSFRVSGSGSYTVLHRVYNECGCYDEEEIMLEVGDVCDFNLSCAGTVCAGKDMTYTVTGPECTDYLWYVEGGTLTAGQHSPEITVRWGNPASGYGSISLDGGPCECECLSRKSVRIPVISDDVTIQGPDVICPDVRQEYTLPLWGSTSYSWSCTPTADATLVPGDMPNKVYLECSQAGVYNLSVTYECPFLSCGPFTAHMQVTVKPTLSITAPLDHEVCLNSAVTFSTNAATASLWKVTRNGVMQSGCPQTAASLTYTFSTLGTYTVTAENPNHCNVASFIVEVKDAPPAIPVGDIDGLQQVCPNSTHQYGATPTSGSYYLRWAWYNDSLRHCVGDSANISFGATIGNISVYQVDRRTGCISPATVYPVTQFTLSPWPYQNPLKVCEGEPFDLDLVADQSEQVLYEWTVKPAYKISIQNNNLVPHISLKTNYTNNTGVHTAKVYLKRTYCYTTEKIDSVTVTIGELYPPTITAPSCICSNIAVPFSVDDEWYVNNADLTQTHWVIDNDESTWFRGLPASITFSSAGQHTLTLHYVSKYGCGATASCNVTVNYFPSIGLQLNGNILSVTGVGDGSGYDYNWIPGGSGGSSIIYNTNVGAYTCIVSSQSNCCEKEVSYNPPAQPPTPCTPLPPQFSLSEDCLGRITVTPYYPNIIPNNCTMTVTQTDSVFTSQLTSLPTSFWLKEVGPYTVCLKWVDNGQCYETCNSGSISELANFSVSSDCDRHIIIHDNSVYSGSRPYRTITVYHKVNGFWVGYTDTYTMMPLTTLCTTTVFPAGQYKVKIAWGQGCEITKTIELHTTPSISSLNIVSPMCEQTPYPFSATAIGDDLAYHWDFGDNSHNYGNNIYHEYENSNNNYTVTLTVTDPNGCQASLTSSNVTIAPKPTADLINQYITDVPDCPGSPASLRYLTDRMQSTFNWYPNIADHTDIGQVYHAGDYRMYETTQQGCHLEAIGNSKYPNGPVAKIICDPVFCMNDQVKAMGNVGNGFSYSWTGTPLPSFLPSSSAPNVSFRPGTIGTYTLGLTVTQSTQNHNCIATDSKEISIITPPQAPSIDFAGNHCLSQGPVGLESSETPPRTLLWSNGTYGAAATFYTAGDASAWYFDPLTGCSSFNASLTIPTPPDFNALLTGCYIMCEGELESLYLPVYSLGIGSGHPWVWRHDNVTDNAGYTPAPPTPLNLPLHGAGVYDLTVTDYGDACSATSPQLVIEAVPCEEINPDVPLDVTVIEADCYTEGCKIYIKAHVMICNNGSFTDVYVDSIAGDINTPVRPKKRLAPMDCFDTIVYIPVVSLMQDSYTLRFLWEGNLVGMCDVSVEDLLKCLELDKCEPIESATLTFNTSFACSDQTACVDFSLTLSSNVTGIIALWCEPGQIITPPGATGTLMIDLGRLTQMVVDDDGQNICLYALCCMDESYLCLAEVCFTVSKVYDAWLENPGSKSPVRVRPSEGGALKETRELALSPNPTTGMITVVDAVTGVPVTDVAQLTVMTMHGQTAMRAERTGSVSVHALPAGTYMVCIKTLAGKTEYLKLTKK